MKNTNVSGNVKTNLKEAGKEKELPQGKTAKQTPTAKPEEKHDCCK